MPKNNVLIILILTGLSIAFVAVSILVFVTKGTNSRFISKKLKLGGAILSLTAMISIGSISCTSGVKCYDVTPTTNWVQLGEDYYAKQSITVNMSKSDVIKGQINHRTGDKFSYKISNSKNETVQSGDIKPLDGVFDTNVEAFEITIDKNIPVGDYNIYLYNTDLENQKKNPEKYQQVYRLKINN